MYDVDRDQVVRLDDLPQCDPGAPMPALAAAEQTLQIGYITLAREEASESIAVVTFHRPYAHFFGPPNDEAFAGHPLASRGLTPYGTFRIENSSWIALLERRNRVHEHHRPEAFAELNHYVLSFHDSTFECVAMGYEFEERGATEPLAIAVEVTP